MKNGKIFESTSGSKRLSKCSTIVLNTSLSNPGYLGKELVFPVSTGPEMIQRINIMLEEINRNHDGLILSWQFHDLNKITSGRIVFYLHCTKHFMAESSQGGTTSLAARKTWDKGGLWFLWFSMQHSLPWVPEARGGVGAGERGPQLIRTTVCLHPLI